ncbi:MAG: hypothetical protein H7A46_06310 [Verrucomicrobiales bacterium]|nr:hypothetical protein [Verrucomicrobiales bacterium]
MPYSICGLIVPEHEDLACAESKWPFVRLAEQVALIPLDRDYLLLSDGDPTEAAEIHGWASPQWLSQMVSRFSRSAYIEAEFWGGTGMQASVVWEAGQITFGPEISTGAINTALRRLGIAGGPAVSIHGLPLAPGRDPFDVVGLGRHRSVGGWLQEIAEHS